MQTPQNARPECPFGLRPYELHGFVVKSVRVTETETNNEDVAFEFFCRSKAFFEIRIDGTSKLVTRRSELEKLAGHRFDTFQVKTERLAGGEGRADAGQALIVTITTTDGGPVVTLTWHIHPAESDRNRASPLHIWMEPRPEELIH